MDPASARRARGSLLGVALLFVGGLAGCANPDSNEASLEGDACIGTDTTAPVPGDECPTGEEGTGSPENDTANRADADLGGE